MRRVVVWGTLAVLVTAGLAYAGRRPLLQAIGRFLMVHDDPQPADAIVVLSGSLPDRILEAVDLYQAHLAPRIILTREEPLPGLDVLRARGGSLPEHHEQNLSIAQQLGVPASVITVMPTPASSTVSEAEALVAYLSSQRIHSILLVTSKAHARRAGLIFRTVAGSSVRVTVCPSPYDPIAPTDWWHHRGFVRRVVIEYGKLLNYTFIDRWRTHAPAPRAE